MKILSSFIVLVVTFGWGTSQAQTVTIRSLENSGPGTLRTALQSSPSNSSRRFVFDRSLDGGTLTLQTGQIEDAADLGVTIEFDASALPRGVTISGAGASRLFRLQGLGTYVFRNITLRNGRTPDGDAATTSGGAIHSEGSLELVDCELRNNSCGTATAGNPVGAGGAIFCVGDVTLTDCRFVENSAGDGFAGSGTSGGTGGFGGAVSAQAGVTATRCVFSENGAGDGGSATGSDFGGNGGSGGAIHSGGALVLTQCEFSANQAGAGGNSADDGNGGDGGSAGAILVSGGGGVTILDSEFFQNLAGNGGDGGTNSGSGGVAGAGGAIVSEGTGGTIIRSTFRENRSGAGGGPVDRAGGGADAGALLLFGSGGSPILTVSNTLFFANSCSKNGGAVYCGSGATIDLIHATIVGNGARVTGGGVDGDVGSRIEVENSIVTTNAVGVPPGTADPNADLGNTGATIAPGQRNIVGGASGLAAIGDNGGFVPSMLPLAGGAAIDGAIVTADTPTTDQRGFVRNFGTAPDLGATELSFQGDNRIGLRPNPNTHRVDNFYSASGAGQRVTSRVVGNRLAKAYVSAQNDGDLDRLRLRITNPGRTTRFFLFRVSAPRRNVFAAARRSGYLTEAVDRGAIIRFEARARSLVRTRSLRSRVGFQVTTVASPAAQDNSLATFLSRIRR